MRYTTEEIIAQYLKGRVLSDVFDQLEGHDLTVYRVADDLRSYLQRRKLATVVVTTEDLFVKVEAPHEYMQEVRAILDTYDQVYPEFHFVVKQICD